MDKPHPSREVDSHVTKEAGLDRDLAGMSLTRLLTEMARLQKTMRASGEHIKPEIEPTTDRERRLRAVYETLHIRGVVVGKDGSLDTDRIEVSHVRAQVERFLASDHDNESEIPELN
jgi:hypothetical protein